MPGNAFLKEIHAIRKQRQRKLTWLQKFHEKWTSVCAADPEKPDMHTLYEALDESPQSLVEGIADLYAEHDTLEDFEEEYRRKKDPLGFGFILSRVLWVLKDGPRLRLCFNMKKDPNQEELDDAEDSKLDPESMGYFFVLKDEGNIGVYRAKFAEVAKYGIPLPTRRFQDILDAVKTNNVQQIKSLVTESISKKSLVADLVKGVESNTQTFLEPMAETENLLRAFHLYYGITDVKIKREEPKGDRKRSASESTRESKKKANKSVDYPHSYDNWTEEIGFKVSDIVYSHPQPTGNRPEHKEWFPYNRQSLQEILPALNKNQLLGEPDEGCQPTFDDIGVVPKTKSNPSALTKVGSVLTPEGICALTDMVAKGEQSFQFVQRMDKFWNEQGPSTGTTEQAREQARANIVDKLLPWVKKNNWWDIKPVQGEISNLQVWSCWMFKLVITEPHLLAVAAHLVPRRIMELLADGSYVIVVKNLEQIAKEEWARARACRQ